MYLLNLSFLAVRGGFRLDLGLRRGAVPAGPLAPPAGGFHPALLGGGGTAGRRRAPAAHPAAVVAGAATGSAWRCCCWPSAQLRCGTPARPAATTSCCSTPPPGWRARSGNGTLMDLARQRARHYLQALPGPRPRDAGARRCAGHPGHGLRTRPPQDRSRHSGLPARRDRAQPGPGAGLRAAHSIAGRRPGRRDRLHRRRPRPRNPNPPPHRRRAICACCWCRTRSKIAACARSACAAPPPTRTCGRSTFRPTITAPARATSPCRWTLVRGGAHGRVAAGSQQLTLQPGGEKEASFEYRTEAAGILGVTLSPHDAFPAR